MNSKMNGNSDHDEVDKCEMCSIILSSEENDVEKQHSFLKGAAAVAVYLYIMEATKTSFV